MKKLIILSALLVSPITYADNFNPCEYMNMTANAAQRLDTGNDDNFKRQYVQNNQRMILACQEYQIKALENERNNINRDNY